MITFVVPFRSKSPERQRIFDWSTQRLKKMYPYFKVVIGEDSGEEFNRSAAINNGVKQVETDLVAVVDADTTWDESLMLAALSWFHSSQKGWLIPYVNYGVTNQISGATILDSPIDVNLSQLNLQYDNVLVARRGDPYPPVSGLFIMRTADMYKVGGFDERFVGWGWEDRAFYYAACTEIGEPRRLDFWVHHIYHPVADIDHSLLRENERLFGDYRRQYQTIKKSFL